MTTLTPDEDGLDVAADALRAGESAVLPLPTPLPYVVAATTAAAVNTVKGRPPTQPCGLLLRDPESVMGYLDLDAESAAFALWVSRVEGASLFVPLGHGAPDWLAAAAVDGLVGITSAWLAQLAPLRRAFGHLSVSSANVTGGAVAVTVEEADAAFGSRLLVLDGDRFRDPGVEHASATIIEIGRKGRVGVARPGVHDRPFPGAAVYLEDLRRRFASRTVRS